MAAPGDAWNKIVNKFGLDPDRYDDFEYLLYLDIDDPFVENYVGFQLGMAEPMIKHRKSFWDITTSLPFLLEVVKKGMVIPFEKVPPRIILPNNKTAVARDTVP